MPYWRAFQCPTGRIQHRRPDHLPGGDCFTLQAFPAVAFCDIRSDDVGMNTPPERAAPVPPSRTGPSSTEEHDARYSVPEAARALGISERAVRKRITVGTLDAYKEGTAWVVSLPATTWAVSTEPLAVVAVPEDGTGAVLSGTGTASVDLSPLVAHIERKDEEIQRLRDAAAGWQFRALRAEERLSQLEAGPIVAPVTSESVTAPVERSEPPGRVDPYETTSRTLQSEPVPTQVQLATGWRRWFRWLMEN